MFPRLKDKMMSLPLLLFAVAVGACICACSDDKRETIALSANPETFPTMRTINASPTISDSGYTRYHITTPLWLMFEEAAEPHWNFPDGLFIVQFNDSMVENGTFTADTATYLSKRKRPLPQPAAFLGPEHPQGVLRLVYPH